MLNAHSLNRCTKTRKLLNSDRSDGSAEQQMGDSLTKPLEKKRKLDRSEGSAEQMGDRSTQPPKLTVYEVGQRHVYHVLCLEFDKI